MKIPRPLALAAGPVLGAIALRALAGTLRIRASGIREIARAPNR